MGYFGRTVIKSSVREITDDNVMDVLAKASVTHGFNQTQIQYLWDYYKGDQPILQRIKKVRPEICNKIVVNYANAIVSFKVGYLCGDPIQYVPRDAADSDDVERLNEMMSDEDKAAKDQEIVEWQMIAGTAYRMVLPGDENPFSIYTLDPRETYVIYSTDIGNKPLLGVKFTQEDGIVTRISAYSEDHYWEIEGGTIVASRDHMLGMVPIIEYPANNARLGSFEIVLDLLDAISRVESNRLDGLEQEIQSLLKFINCDISTDDFSALKELGAIKIKSTDNQQADVDVISTSVSQDQGQIQVDDLYQAVLEITGMPNRNGGSSTSDTGAAVLLRDGWSAAEARAKDSENMFKRSEWKMLKLVLALCRELGDIKLEPKQVSCQFTRRNYENIQSKAQVLVAMLQNNKIHPLQAYQHCGMFSDPEKAYAMGMDWYEAEMRKWDIGNVEEEEVDVSESRSLPSGIENSYTPGIQSTFNSGTR